MFKTDRVCQWDNGPYRTLKAALSGNPTNDQKLAFKTDYRLMQVKRITECSWSIL